MHLLPYDGPRPIGGDGASAPAPRPVVVLVQASRLHLEPVDWRVMFRGGKAKE
jgi:hypothetical protein